MVEGGTTGVLARVFLALLIAYIAFSLLGYWAAKSSPSYANKLFEKVKARLPAKLSVKTIFLHNLTAVAYFTAPYALVRIIVRGRSLAARILAYLPLILIAVNGFLVGVVFFQGCNTLGSKEVAAGCHLHGLSLYAAVLSLIIPHGVIEVPAVTLLASLPIAFERGLSLRAALLALAAAITLLLAAAFVEVYVTPLVYAFTLMLFCGAG